MNTPQAPSPPAPEGPGVSAAAEGPVVTAAPEANGHAGSPPPAPSAEPQPPPPQASAGAPAEIAAPAHDDGSTPHDEPPAQEDEAEGDAQAHGESTGGSAEAGVEKKRRRRRRRKKGPAGAEGEAAPADAADGAGGAAPAEPAGDAAPHAAKPGPEKRPKKERRPGPPRERPPVNAGDIVFGKILKITDDAILIDIPGKAHAIFDRREMLLADDDEAPPPAPEAAPEASSAEAQSSEPGAAEPVAAAPTEGGAPPAAEVEAATPGAEPGTAPGLGPAPAPEPADAPAPPEPVAAVTPAAEPEAAPAPEAAHEPYKDPKVPRVILEVGADFIGVVHGDGSRGGLVVLTHHPRRAERTKPLVEKAAADGTFIEGLVTGVIKGGIEVDVGGLRAFAPGSHVELRLGANLSHLVGQRLPFAVTQYAKRGRDVVLSRRALLEEEAKKTRAEALGRLKVGEEVEGVVRSVVGFGAFVDIGGIEGLVPLPEMSHNRADGPSDVFKAGEPTRVKILKIDDRGKVWLSHKATIPDPWQAVAQKYALGSRHSGKVVRLHAVGAFIELESGIDGLVHTQDLSIKRIENPEEVVKVGDTLDVVVAHLDAEQHRIRLHPAIGEAAGEAPQRVVPHKPVKAKIVTIEAGGLLVRILGVTGRNARGYVTAAGTGTPRGTELRKVFSAGQEIEAKVIEVDPRRGEVKLSIKALSDDQERSAYQQYRQQLKAEARFTFGDLLAKKTKA